MGNQKSVFTAEQMEEYQDCTYFTKADIIRIFNRFRNILPGQIPKYMDEEQPYKLKIPMRAMVQIEELRENPFKFRICKVFSEDGTGNMSFNDFVDMLSVMCESAPRELKTHYAFKIHDFDEDNYLGKEDIEKALDYITRDNQLESEDIKFVVDRVLAEADLDEDNKLSYVEFELLVSKCPDFMSSFHIRA